MQKGRGWGFASAVFAFATAGVLCAAGAFAAALVADVEGDVRISVSGAKSQAIAPGQRLASGSRVTTAAGARVVLHFDDGQWAALHENTALHIEDYRFRPQEPAADRAAFALLRGALRIVTGVLGRRSPDAFELRTPTMLIGIRGTDFMVAIANPVYLSVLEGTVATRNAGGTATFKAGELGAASEEATPAAAIRADALPAVVRAAFGRLGAMRIAQPAAPAAAGKAGVSEDAPAQGPEAASFGRDIADRARQLKLDAARERARDDAMKSRPK